ncbi:hypothetical protein CATMQ487_28130 [Sphaerotilus microaerophilus]|uniref:Uncharacterized protein n=1 Tax=Sphaerotilus microaerophilus TaxID=2914710 RepID=A0ABN6PMS0_9BURK|nr:hypothetical protein CATMQ487_28130 [Sphaerotilus sp. FB-5]
MPGFSLERLFPSTYAQPFVAGKVCRNPLLNNRQPSAADPMADAQWPLLLRQVRPSLLEAIQLYTLVRAGR